CTFGIVRTISASRRLPTSRFQPGIALMYACTGLSPSPIAICGLPPDSSLGFGAIQRRLRAVAVDRFFVTGRFFEADAFFFVVARAGVFVVARDGAFALLGVALGFALPARDDSFSAAAARTSVVNARSL